MVGTSLQQNFSLAQTLSPQMQQSLHFLQAPVMELRSLVQQELQQNPALEEKEHERDEAADEIQDESPAPPASSADDSWREFFPQHQSTTPRNHEEQQKKRDFFFDSQVQTETLSQHLRQQLQLGTQNPQLLDAGEIIIGNLDENGFLSSPLDELAASSACPLPVLQQALQQIQGFTPSGVAARDLKESLLIQLRDLGDTDSLTTTLVKRELDRIARKRYLELGRHYKVSPARIQEIAAKIGKLNPRPGAAFATPAPQDIVIAEAEFIKKDGIWQVELNNNPVPQLRISNTFKDLLGSDPGGDKALKDYLRERIRAGKFLIKCLHQRQQTIENILNEIARRQTDFLENGVSQLKPLTMNQVATAVNVHETTVSRAAANKFVRTPWGVFPVKFFFTSGFTTRDGQNLANSSIKDQLAELIAHEDVHHPLSDSEIVQIMREKGIDLARRTVAKYRAELNILPSNLRRHT